MDLGDVEQTLSCKGIYTIDLFCNFLATSKKSISYNLFYRMLDSSERISLWVSTTIVMEQAIVSITATLGK